MGDNFKECATSRTEGQDVFHSVVTIIAAEQGGTSAYQGLQGLLGLLVCLESWQHLQISCHEPIFLYEYESGGSISAQDAEATWNSRGTG